MNAAHTPGPWLIATSNSWRRVVSESGAVCEPIKQPDGHPDLHFRNGGSDGPDARLIASAPELFAACKAQHRAIDILLAKLIALDGDFMPTRSEAWEACVMGHAAIVKASGGAS